jgi:predicted DNA binding CopG/RHH family protein
MTKMNFDQEEKELLESYEKDEWQPVTDLESEKERYQAYAAATFKKDKRVNIRISSKDLEALQTRALEEGIPYQTLMASVLHKYVSGKMVEKSG